VFAKNGARIQTALRGHVALDDENSYLAAAEAGLGVAQIPAFVLKEALERGTLELVLGDVFVDWVAELFAEHDGIQLRSTLRNHA
jgi:LysR family transcriptional regulator, regulator for bpeEF and oprC